MMKGICIVGHGRHGKDTVAEFMHELYGFNFASSSETAARIFLFDALKDKYGYQTFQECYEDRGNHRTEWHDLICEYNYYDKARLAKDILKDNDIYVGMRSDEELQECLRQGLFDLVIGVFNPHKPLESPESFNIDIWKMSHLILPNAGTKRDLKKRVRLLKPTLIPDNKLIYHLVPNLIPNI